MDETKYKNKLQGEGEEVPPLGKFLGGQPSFKVLHIYHYPRALLQGATYHYPRDASSKLLILITHGLLALCTGILMAKSIFMWF